LVAVFKRIFEAEATTIFVAEAAGRLVGLASLIIRPRLNWIAPEGSINELVVDVSYRRLGIARALLDVCANEARSSHCRLLRLTAAHHRTEAHDLYEGYGFTHAGRDYQLAL
jgi:ribosomal protein S18 acetylase RimI-like enzyme